MKIGIDARLIEETGVGRYIRNLIEELDVFDQKNRYVVFLRQKSWTSLQLPNKRWEKRLAEVPWHTFKEQLVMPWLLLKEQLDLVHIPYHNPPIFYPGKTVVTIHDLTILHFDTGRATTLPGPLYRLKRLGYYLVLAVGLRRAKRVIAVSKATKQEVIDHFGLNPDKIAVTYEGTRLQGKRQKAKGKSEERLIKNPYFLYVGNAYPHKNLEMLLKAFQLSTYNLQLITKLVLVGNDDFFYQRLKNEVKQMGLEDKVIFWGPASDSQLVNLYSQAIALVFPSLMEGFGLPGVEAMARGVPVVCSDIPVFREVYGDAPVYFDPHDFQDIAHKLNLILNDVGERQRAITTGTKIARRYSWENLAKLTLKVYESSTGV
ncbi:MAG: glycosyltransferase family 4 protein [Patescibacteria group bacterium]